MWPAPCRSSKPTTHGNLPHDSTYLLDGMLINSTIADGRAQNYIDNAIVQETTYQTSSVTAEVSGGGVYTNMVGWGFEVNGSVYSNPVYSTNFATKAAYRNNGY